MALNFSPDVVQYDSTVDLGTARVVKETETGTCTLQDRCIVLEPYCGVILTL